MNQPQRRCTTSSSADTKPVCPGSRRATTCTRATRWNSGTDTTRPPRNPVASGINFAASIVSLLFGEGDYRETVKIAVLAGWDSDNPAATWGGLLGFLYGKQGIEAAFGQEFSDRYHIHRTRTGFPVPDGVDNFPSMAAAGVEIVDRVVVDEIRGEIRDDHWVIPLLAVPQ